MRVKAEKLGREVEARGGSRWKDQGERVKGEGQGEGGGYI